MMVQLLGGRALGHRRLPGEQVVEGTAQRVDVAEDVGIAQPAAGVDAEFATAKKLKFGLMLTGLLDGKMRMTEVTLIDPVIAVPSAPTKPVVGKQAVGAEGDRPGGSRAPKVAKQLSSLSLDKLVIENGTVILPPSGQMPGKRI